MSSASSNVIVALDYNDERDVFSLVDHLNPSLCKLKVGKELFTAEGPQLVTKLVDLGYDVFLDLKFHDIPNTVANAVLQAANLGVWMINVHASGGRAMMEAAKAALNNCSGRRPLLTAVTVLTSLSDESLEEVGIECSAAVQVYRLAALTKAAGLDGVVCSAQEAEVLRREAGKDFLLVTPGIRPAGADKGDQSRVVTPAKAIANGADYLVIGRPITQAKDPQAALQAIIAEIN